LPFPAPKLGAPLFSNHSVPSLPQCFMFRPLALQLQLARTLLISRCQFKPLSECHVSFPLFLPFPWSAVGNLPFPKWATFGHLFFSPVLIAFSQPSSCLTRLCVSSLSCKRRLPDVRHLNPPGATGVCFLGLHNEPAVPRSLFSKFLD